MNEVQSGNARISEKYFVHRQAKLKKKKIRKENFIAKKQVVFASLLINFSYSFKDMNYSETYKEFNL